MASSAAYRLTRTGHTRSPMAGCHRGRNGPKGGFDSLQVDWLDLTSESRSTSDAASEPEAQADVPWFFSRSLLAAHDDHGR